MADLVVTCPKDFWRRWLEEGDAAGDPPSGEEWGWFMSDRLPEPPIGPGDRLYVVSWGWLRGYAPVTRLMHRQGSWIICREAGAVACGIAVPAAGFRGWRHRWWDREAEVPFVDWKTAGVGVSAPQPSFLFDSDRAPLTCTLYGGTVEKVPAE